MISSQMVMVFKNSQLFKRGKDIYISASQIRRFEIKRGDKVTGKVRKPKDNEKYYGLLQVDFVNDQNAEEVKNVLTSKL